MKTFYIPIHFYEQESTDDEVVMLITKRDIGKCELDSLLMEEVRRHRSRSYPTREDMVDGIFDSLAKRISGVWSYCETLSTLHIGDSEPDSTDADEMRAVDATEFAALLVKLNASENLDFYLPYDEKSGKAEEPYGAALIGEFDSFVILINCYGGGLPCAIDVSCYQSDLIRISEELTEYFSFMENKPTHVYVSERFAKMLETR